MSCDTDLYGFCHMIGSIIGALLEVNEASRVEKYSMWKSSMWK